MRLPETCAPKLAGRLAKALREELFPPEFLATGRRQLEAPGGVMAEAAEAEAYMGTARKMWPCILRPFARRALRNLPTGGRILDLGTGAGLMPAYWARKRPDAEVVAVDLSAAMLDRARAHAERRGVAGRVHFLAADATDTGLPDASFDVVVCHYMLHHFADPTKVLREMARLVRPGGVVLARDLVRPGPAFALLSTMFTKVALRNTREQNRQYAELLAASLTADELRAEIDRAGFSGFEVRGGPIHLWVRRAPLAAPAAAARQPMTHEAAGRLLAGASLLTMLALGYFLSPLWLLGAAGVALNLVLSGVSGRCAVKNFLIRLGLPGERDLGRAEALEGAIASRQGLAASGARTEGLLPRRAPESHGKPRMAPRNRLTRAFRELERELGPTSPASRPRPAGPTGTAWRHIFAEGRYALRVANDRESREKAYRLVYRLYLEKEYAQPNASELWLSTLDARPETLTLLVERVADGEAVGAMTVFADSALGLPADGRYKPELDALRAAGRRLCEFGSLAVAEEGENGKQALVELYSFASTHAREVLGAGDLVITVNPRHVKFYERTLLFEPAGPERSYGKVGGAPALLLRLDLAAQREAIRREHEPQPAGERPSRLLYKMFHPLSDEPEMVAELRGALQPMSEAELRYFFVGKTDLLARAGLEERARLQAGMLPGPRTRPRQALTGG